MPTKRKWEERARGGARKQNWGIGKEPTKGIEGIWLSEGAKGQGKRQRKRQEGKKTIHRVIVCGDGYGELQGKL